MRHARFTSSIRALNAGFSFPEVLFAVAILGVGFIMVAAMFPVAIRQTHMTVSETAGATLARGGAAQLAATSVMTRTPPSPLHDVTVTTITPPSTTTIPGASASTTPVPTSPPGPNPPYPAPANPARVFSFNDPRIVDAATRQAMWDSVRVNMIVPSDPRYAWVPLYRREAGFDYVEMLIFGLECRGRGSFGIDTDADGIPDAVDIDPAELEPRPIIVALTERVSQPDEIWIEPITAAYDAALEGAAVSEQAMEALVEGAYIVISDDRAVDNGATPQVNEYGRANGRVYRLGNRLSPEGASPVKFELAAGYDMNGVDEQLPSGRLVNQDPPASIGGDWAIAFVVGGRGYVDPLVAPTAETSFTGPAMGVQEYRTLKVLR